MYATLFSPGKGGLPVAGHDPTKYATTEIGHFPIQWKDRVATMSNEKSEPKVLWFEHIAPIKWYIADHVEEGRGALNISEWHTNPGRDTDAFAEVVEKGSMPPDFYTYFGLHSDSKLTETEKQQLIDGIEKTLAADPPASGR